MVGHTVGAAARAVEKLTGSVRPVRVLMLTWEYPPLTGGAAAHVDGLSKALRQAGHDVVVLTVGPPGAASPTMTDVRVLRAAADLPWIPDDDLVARAASANHHLVRLTTELGDWRPGVVHAHNWQCAWAATTIAALHDVPLVTTFHTTLRGQHGGRIPPGEPSTIHAVESWLAHGSDQIIAPSMFMSREVLSGFELPAERIHRVPNGIDPTWWSAGAWPESRPPLVLTWGRVQYEKGFQVLAQAMSNLRSRVPDLECIIAGRGSYLPELQSQVDIEGVSDIVRLVGFVPDVKLRDLVHRASCVAIPSLYEPFGIVALETLAGGAPLIAARTGGLAELIAGTGAGLLFEPGNADELANCIERVLGDPRLADDMRARGTALLGARYSWVAIAAATALIYAGATPAETDAALSPT
jgi:glycogen(starch) synthase